MGFAHAAVTDTLVGLDRPRPAARRNACARMRAQVRPSFGAP